jgi:hypothetical protein
MKIIVILRSTPSATLDQILAVLPEEEKRVWSYLGDGRLRAMHYNLAEEGSVVLEFEGQDVSEVKASVEAFPLLQQQLMQAQYLPLKPYTGLALLFDPRHGIAL